MTLACGQKFKAYDKENGQIEGTYVLAQVDIMKVCLINIETGNRWTNPVSVNDVMAISIKEWEEIGGIDFEDSLQWIPI